MSELSQFIIKSTKNVGIAFGLVILWPLLAGGGAENAKQREAERLGFKYDFDMQSAHEEGWHTNAQYQADEGARAKRLGFVSIFEMEIAEYRGARNKAEYDRYMEREAANAENEESQGDISSDNESVENEIQIEEDVVSDDNSGGFFGALGKVLGVESTKKAVKITMATRALNPGVSARSDYAAWEEAGGFSYDSNWRRYPITATRVAYTNDVLSFLELKMGTYASDFDGEKFPSFQNMKSDLSKWCGSSWKTSALSPNGREASSGNWKCTVEIPSNGSGLGIQIMAI
jgi:hypothetical protein